MKEPSEQGSRPFGPTRCGEILFERVKDDRKLRRVVSVMYHESRLCLKHIDTLPTGRIRNTVRGFYLRERTREIMAKPWSDDIKKRLLHCIKAKRVVPPLNPGDMLVSCGSL